jgi:WhiB family redox-sensing transcriptional regulator
MTRDLLADPPAGTPLRRRSPRRMPPRPTRQTVVFDVVPLPEMDGTQPCAVDPEWWFPDGDGSTPTSRAAAAGPKAECRTCPYVAGCLAYAMTRHLQGVWGGTTEAERRGLRRRTRPTQAA